MYVVVVGILRRGIGNCYLLVNDFVCSIICLYPNYRFYFTFFKNKYMDALVLDLETTFVTLHVQVVGVYDINLI